MELFKSHLHRFIKILNIATLRTPYQESTRLILDMPREKRAFECQKLFHAKFFGILCKWLSKILTTNQLLEQMIYPKDSFVPVV